jgi:small subunit ribosomal protein S16
MAVVIRMKRTGRKNRPCYRISVADRSLPRDGRTLDTLGVYDPASPKPELRLKIDVERAKHWLSKGALPSETVRSILKKEGAYEGVTAKPPRKRPGRKTVTAKRKRRLEAASGREEKKQARHAERVGAKRAAAKAAAAQESESEES